MKKFFLSFLMASTVAVAPALALSRSASMKPIMEKSENLVEYLEDEQNMEIVRMEYDILSDVKTTTRVLSSGYTYFIVAFGDYRFKDIDVKVYRRSAGGWVEEAKDVDTSATAVVTVTPSYTEEYKIEIKAYSFEPGYDVGHYGLIIAHE